MRFIKIILCIIGLCGTFAVSSPALAKHKKHKIPTETQSVPAEIAGSGNLSAIIDRAINNTDPTLNIGIAIKSMKTGEILYTHNSSKSFMPASIMKILTAEAALLYLGSDYKFQTSFYTDASSISNGVVYGNLYLVHSGDPTLTYANLVELMDALKAQQIQHITGGIYVDTTAYDQVYYGPGWIWNDKRFCYAAPISASIVNHNCLSFQIAPAKEVGHAANIIENSNYYYSILNSVTTKSPYAKSCYLKLGTNPDSSISITGCMPKGKYTQGVSTVVNDIIEYNKSLVRNLFQRSGIQVDGLVTSGAAPPNVSVVVSHQSKPLYQLISEMLKKSDNIIAGSLFKKLGEKYSGQPGSWENGSRAVSEILASKAHVNTYGLSVLDGSGLSRYNQVSPDQMLQVLDFAFHNVGTNYEFISGLPVAGVDGTLKHRMYNVAWKVRAKTGTMQGVNALAGYAVTQDKEPLAFVIIVNGKLGMGWKYKELEDHIVTTMTHYSRG